MAATDLSKMLNEDRIRLAWKDAYDVHIWGFHKAKYRIDDVKAFRCPILCVATCGAWVKAEEPARLLVIVGGCLKRPGCPGG